MNARRIVATALVTAVAVVGTVAPAEAATPRVKGTADVCVLRDYGVQKSWTKGTQRAANRAYKQRVKVRWINEDHWSRCDIIVFGSDDGAYDYGTDQPSENSRYSVSYDRGHRTYMINVSGSATPVNARKATLVKAIGEAGVR